MADGLGLRCADADRDVVLSGVSLDSRGVRAGDLYAALPGARSHGADHLEQAAAAGAVAVLTDRRGGEQASVLPTLVAPDPRAVLGDLAASLYGHPQRALTTFGITGTNGKTTTSYLLDAVLRAAGHSTGLIGTVETRVADERIRSVRTTPEAPDLYALLAVMVERGVGACTMEVSSHALALHRVDGLRFDVAGFSNLSQDHLDLHGDLESYFAVKASLFTPQRCAAAVICIDDPWGVRLAGQTRQSGVPVTTVATHPDAPGADWQVLARTPRAGGIDLEVRGPSAQPLRLWCPLPGDFNVANTVLAAVMAITAGVGEQVVAQGLADAGGVPGRMQRVGGRSGTPQVVIDYAHTPAAVATALQALRTTTTGRLVVVLGAGGDRDPGKRAAMGAAAASHADIVIVTDDNPRSEQPVAIRAAVLAGARGVSGHASTQVHEMGDRRHAVFAALALADGEADTVLIAGKGHETGQEVAGVVLPFDDAEVAREALAATQATREASR